MTATPRVTLVEGGRDAPKVTIVSSRKRKKQKASGLLRPAETLVRCVAETQREGARQYLRRHKRSNRKRRDGWVVDFIGNVVASQRKAYNRARGVLGLKFLPKA
jgi:hypothetical protein